MRQIDVRLARLSDWHRVHLSVVNLILVRPVLHSVLWDPTLNWMIQLVNTILRKIAIIPILAAVAVYLWESDTNSAGLNPAVIIYACTPKYRG